MDYMDQNDQQGLVAGRRKPQLPRLLRRLTLSHDGEPFLERWGLVWDRLGGVYIHHIAAADPGMDLHDHPFAFVTIVVRGGYFERYCDTRQAALRPEVVRGPRHLDHEGRYWGWRKIGDITQPNCVRRRRLPSVHFMPLHIAHQIEAVDKNTWTIVLRGPTRRRWGFYDRGRWVDWEAYDYEVRRPSSAVGNGDHLGVRE